MSMNITTELMRRAGKITLQFSFTDEELDLAVLGTTLALEYLEGIGNKYTLAITPLRQDLETFKSFQQARKRDKHVHDSTYL